MSSQRNWIAAQTSVAAIGVLISLGITLWHRPPTAADSNRRLDIIDERIEAINDRLDRLETQPDRIPIFRPGRQ